ncbi:hypothetical protein POM88_010305 [Heracleum sosnowskyi]|uniref:DUF6598 domain-containing protein n=1 Tax=Heracleum sosnowskyi TaxID=360622 RepID=A0AAD8MZT8_9APIA|nr:hypothetical protein POM88_010305 [Heracleum sosnowskyi]
MTCENFCNQQTPDLDLQLCNEQTSDSDPEDQHVYLSSSNRYKPMTFVDNYPEFKLGVPQDHCRATPLFNVASVRIDSNQFKGLKYVKIYGTIVLIDDHGNEFYIFDCKNRDDAKTFIPKTPTSVILQNFQPRGVPGKFCLLFHLKRRLQAAAEKDIVIFRGYKYIDCTKEVPYDKPQFAVFHRRRSRIIVTYTIFQCALLAEVGIIVEKTDKDDESGVAGITGGIDALTRGLSDDNVCTLLDVSREKFDFGNYTPLSTLAVPAYSSLEFQGQLCVNGEELSCGLIFEPFTLDNIFHEKQIGGRQYRIRVIVFWMPGAISLTEGELLEYYVKASETPFTKNQRPTSKLLETNNAYYIQPDVRQYLDDLELEVNYLSTELLEIFSISVCAYDQDNCPEGKTFSLKGKVECFDCIGSLCIFDSDSEGVSTSGDIVKLVPDLGRGFVGSTLKIVTDLKDNQGREVSFGSAIYNFHNIELWRDKLICSVIRGQNGFASVHYSIFTDAILAKLSLKVVYNFESGGATDCKVYGSVDTSYSNFNYSTHYAKKYYRSTLFEKKEFDALELAGGEKVPLSKSVVAVPVYGLLVVEAIVYAQNDKHSEKLEFKETFSPAGAAIEKFVKKSRPGSFSLFMDVEWVRRIPLIPVIRGQNGFASVHYSIFTDAILAKLSLKVVYNFESGGATGCKVYGSVDTSYSNFNYSTHYAKKYYRSTLFEKKESDALKLAGGEKVPLSKSVVAVPVYGLLVVEAIIYAQNDKHSEKLKFKETFSPAEAAINKSRLGKSFGLSMDVEWVRDIPLI